MEIFDLHSYFDSYESEALSVFVPTENCVGKGLVNEEYDVAIIGVPSAKNEEASIKRSMRFGAIFISCLIVSIK